MKTPHRICIAIAALAAVAFAGQAPQNRSRPERGPNPNGTAAWKSS